MSDLEKRLAHAVREAQALALVTELLSNPEITIGELASVRGDLRSAIQSLTLGELRRGALDDPAGAKPRTRSAKPRTRTAKRSASASTPGARKRVATIETRTAAGRSSYDAALLAALVEARAPVSASDLRGRVGGSADQARRGLNRLISSGRVGFSGRARGTTYFAV